MPRSIEGRVIAWAVFSGFALVAIAIYLGLTHDRRGSENGVDDHRQHTMPAHQAAHQDEASVAQAREQARMALQAHVDRDMLSPCWERLLAQEAGPVTSIYRIQLAFATDGREVGRAISEVREHPSRYDVVQCLRGFPPGLSIAPLSRPLTLEFELHFGEGALVLDSAQTLN
jgi:hypothetical protein